METDRRFYEAQGEQALREGTGFHCSQPEVTNAVIAMARDYLHESTRILDVGCGANLDYDLFLADKGKNPVCMDFTLNFLRLAPKDARVSLLQADATALPFADSTFDLVVCSETIEHVPRDDVAVREIARVLRPHGVLLITVPNLWNASRVIDMIKQRDFTVRLMTGHLREYTPAHIRRVLQPYFIVEKWLPVGFSWKGWFGGPVDSLVTSGILKRLSKSIAFAARRRESFDGSAL